MKSKLTLGFWLVTGFLLGSKAGPKPWEMFVSGLNRLRRTSLVSKSIERTADGVSGAVRRKGVEMSDKAANAVHRTIVGNHPVVIEARVSETVAEDLEE